MQQATLVKYDNKCVSWSVGHPPQPGEKDSIQFDWSFRNKIDIKPDLIHFYHAHPTEELLYSEVDIECVKEINSTLGFSAFFSIVSFPDLTNLADDRFDLVTYRYNDELIKMSVNRDKSTLTTAEALTLKTLFTATIF